MAKVKITSLTTITDGSISSSDLIPFVDVSDTTQAASGTTKNATITSLATAVASAFSGDNATFVNLTTTGTTTLGDSADATTVNGTLGVTGITTLTGNVGIGVAPAAPLHIESNANSSQKIFIKNTTSGTAAITGISLYNNSGVTGAFNAYSSAYTTSGPNVADGATVAGNAHLGLDAFGASGYVAVYTGASELERMRITSAGLVGIGTVGPTGKLQIGDFSAGEPTYPGYVRMISAGNGPEAANNGLEFGNSVSGAGFGYKLFTNNSNDYFGIATRNNSATWTERMVVNQITGNVGIGRTPTTLALEVNGDASKTSSGTWSANSDERLKTNIELADLKKCTELLKSIPLKRFTWKDDSLTIEQAKDRSKLGWIAQEVKQYLPKAVIEQSFSKVKVEDGFELVEEDVFIETETEVDKKEIKLVGGKYQEVITKEVQKNKEQVFEEFDLFDEAGKVIGKHKVAKKQKVSKPKFKQEVIEDCLSLNADQIYAAMYGAVQLLIQKVEALEAK